MRVIIRVMMREASDMALLMEDREMKREPMFSADQIV